MVYVHIPYCRTHCTYCGFYSELLRQGDSPAAQKFVGKLIREIHEAHSCGEMKKAAALNTLYIGGGTPSLLTPSQIGEITAQIRPAVAEPFEEFTIEVNPDDIVSGGGEYARALRSLGVTRISMGIQSLDDAVLHRMGRRHNAREAVEAFEILREAGFDNVSIDLIFGFAPAMDMDAVRDFLLEHRPEHLSCYQLSIEQDSALEKMVQRGKYVMPTDEQCETQYYDFCALLRELGYEHYEISNWSLPGHRARHNSGYWNHTPYIGFGPGAHSLLGTVRRWNNPDLHSYLDTESFDAVRGSETLTAEQLLQERIMLGLRTSEGVPRDLLDTRKMQVALERGELEEIETRVRIPEDRWFVSDAIIVNLIP